MEKITITPEKAFKAVKAIFEDCEYIRASGLSGVVMVVYNNKSHRFYMFNDIKIDWKGKECYPEPPKVKEKSYYLLLTPDEARMISSIVNREISGSIRNKYRFEMLIEIVERIATVLRYMEE